MVTFNSIENELFYNIMLTKEFELPFYNPPLKVPIFVNNVFKQNIHKQSDRLMTAFLDNALVDHWRWTGKTIRLAHNTCNFQAAIFYPKINVYKHNFAFNNQVMNLSPSFEKCFNFWILEEREVMEKEKDDLRMKQYKDTISHCSLENQLFCISKTYSKASMFNFKKEFKSLTA